MPAMADVIRAYRMLRQQKKELVDKQKAELAPFNTKMAKLEAWMLDELNREGADHVGTSEGTAYKTTRSSVTVDDWEAALETVREHELWHMLERRLSKTAVEQYVEAEGCDFPGTHISTEIVVNVRAS